MVMHSSPVGTSNDPLDRNRTRSFVHRRRAVALSAVGLLTVGGCASSSEGTQVSSEKPTIVVSNAILGAVTAEIAGSDADVTVLIPNGIDPHLYEPSAKDIETLNSADLVVVNGLGLESQLEESLDGVRSNRIPIFEATDHITVRRTDTDKPSGDVHGDEHGDVHGDAHGDEHGDVHGDGAGETHTDGQSPVDSSHAHQHGGEDPHFWTDPQAMAEVVEHLGEAITDLGLDIGDRAMMFAERLVTFDQDLLDLVESLPAERRVLVTGHESLGYLADRYGFDIVGTILPGLSSGSEVSAENLASVKKAVEKSGVDVVFTELGTPSASARVLADELQVEVVEISTHQIPDSAMETDVGGEAYLAFIDALVRTIVSALSA